MTAKVYITLKSGLLDAQGATIHKALESLGFKDVKNVRMGKYLELKISHNSVRSAKREVERMCQKLLANPVVETYRIELTNAVSPLSIGRKAQDERKGKFHVRRRES